MEESSGLVYSLGEKENLELVLLNGKLGSKDISTLERLGEELRQKTQLIVILDFSQLKSMSAGVYGPFALFQKQLRDAGKYLALCGLMPVIRDSLLQTGISRQVEMFDNIGSAWKSLNFRFEQDKLSREAEKDKESSQEISEDTENSKAA